MPYSLLNNSFLIISFAALTGSDETYIWSIIGKSVQCNSADIIAIIHVPIWILLIWNNGEFWTNE